MWRCEFDPRTSALSACRESPSCTKQQQDECLEAPDNEVGCLCTAGDGKLHVWATAGEIKGMNTCFLFGNTKRETNVDLAVFRELLKSFRAKP